MALSDCPKCWETPCCCGEAAKKWSESVAGKKFVRLEYSDDNFKYVEFLLMSSYLLPRFVSELAVVKKLAVERNLGWGTDLFIQLLNSERGKPDLVVGSVSV